GCVPDSLILLKSLLFNISLMAHRSDTNNRNLPNTWNETVFNGELNGYDRALDFPFDGEISELEENLSDLEVEVYRDDRKLREAATILYHLDDQDEIYDLVS
ncbi:MAG: hypothetical protein V5A72_00470, partial [Candidatus Nanohaloarchaea archaeon]